MSRSRRTAGTTCGATGAKAHAHRTTHDAKATATRIAIIMMAISPLTSTTHLTTGAHHMPRQPATDHEFRAFCQTGRGFTFATNNYRLHKADCALLPYAYARDKLLWEWEGLSQVLNYLNRYRQGWEPCPHCCAADVQNQQQNGFRQQQSPPKTPPPSSAPTELQRAFAFFSLTETATLPIAEAAYKAWMKTGGHPDKGGSTAKAQEGTRAIEIIRTHYQQQPQYA